MVSANDPAALSMAADAQGVERLKHLARNDPNAAIKETARQFEAMLMGALLKTMRETTSEDSVFDSDQTRLYTSLLDQQLAQTMAGRGIGLAQVLERQLSGSAGVDAVEAMTPDAGVPRPIGLRDTPGVADIAPRPAIAGAKRAQETVSGAQSAQPHALIPPHVQDFVGRMLPHALMVSERTGIPARFLIGHAALESGWGRSEIRHADGTSSHNVFAIKADSAWRGNVAEVATTEYVDGVPVKRAERFRAYDSYDEAFRDYAAFLRENPRYARALDATHSASAFARHLQAAGYATDPRYADKLAGVIDGRSLRTTLA